MKTILIHTPKFNNFYKPIGDFIWLNYMPMGLLAIADHGVRNGHDVEVVHLGVEWIENRDFRIDELVRDPDIRAVGFCLHWHHQAWDVIEAARRIRTLRNDVFIFAGGDTASFYHEELLRDFPEIDAVVRGYGEASLCGLLDAVKENGGLERIPNLSWRDGARVCCNAVSYTGDADLLNGLSYTNFSLLRHAHTYIHHTGVPFFFAKRFTKKQNLRLFTLGSPVFPLPAGRGCPFTCSWCSGSQTTQARLISGMAGCMYRAHDSVIADIRAAVAAGYRIMHTAFDPEPVRQEYFIDLWRRIRQENIQVDWMFECNGLPSDTFVDEFARTFPGKHSTLALSPESGNEALRLRHKGPGFSTAALLEKMDRIDRRGLATEVFFSFGLPGENEDLLQETVALQKTLRSRYRTLRSIRTLSIEIEPGAPWQLDPEAFGIVTDRRLFRDFYAAHSAPGQGTFTSFGYYIPDYFHRPLDSRQPYADFARRMQDLKCRHFCFIHPNPAKTGRPWQGRLMCAVASRLVALKPENLSRPY